ncbi:Tryprostatin B 6-hydroxylase [Podospora australis]|uniref:Tryprostatin B 6-hydroxylase n=1 Tax=Podospora australis TaxID=1536484 RepID=A0AAN6WTQ2_9PEZI|nr:Tryprostatin B 6-hydroxylase [Podospora australis]
MELLTHFWTATAVNDLRAACVFAATTGVLSHVLYFIRGYHDTRSLRIFLGHALAYNVGAGLAVTKLGLWNGIIVSTILSSTYLASLFASIVVYRLFFHPLRRFPGPVAAKITRFYGPWIARNGHMHLEHIKLHKKYGTIVRMAPNELFILSSEAIPKMHAAKSGCRKKDAGVYNHVTYKGERNIDSIMTREEHRWRRQVWEKAFTTKALAIYEESTREVCHTWLDKLSTVGNQPINTSVFALLIGFDHMGKIGFTHDFNTIQEGREHHMLDLLETMFGAMGKLGELAWPLAILKDLNIEGEAAEFNELSRQLASKREQDHDEKHDIISYFIRDLRSEKPVAFFNQNILHADANFILIAATDTIGVVLSYAFYHLAKNHAQQSKLRNEISAAFGSTIPKEFISTDLAKIEHLDAVINETLRLDNPVASNAARLTPPEGITVEGVWIPGGVAVRVPGYAMMRSERAFVHPDDFIPERWTTEPGLVLEPEAFFPFLTGPNNCVGKRLAMNVLRLVLSYTVFHYEFEFAPGEDGTAIYARARDNLVIRAGPLNLVFKKRD